MKLHLPLLVLVLSLPVARAVCEPAPIKIGWIGPLSGPSAVVGIDAAPAIRLVFDEVNARGGINGRKIELIAEDDRYVTAESIAAYHKLQSAEQVNIIFSSTYGAVFATASDARRDDVLMIDTLDCNDDIAALPENTLCIATWTGSIAEGFVANIVQRKIDQTLILVEDSDPWMQFIAERTAESLRSGGRHAVIEQTSISTTDYKPQLLKNRGSGAIIALGNDEMGTALRQAKQLGMRAQFYGVGSMLSPGFQQLAGSALEGAFASSWQAPHSAEREHFIRSFNARIGRDPFLELSVIPGYDMANILVTCLKSAARDDIALRTEDIRSCILQTQGYRGAAGEIRFDADGAVRSIRERLYRIHDGKLTDM